jgi:hypothetical protein
MICLAGRASALLVGGPQHRTACRSVLRSRMLMSAVGGFETEALRLGDAPAPSPRRPVSITDAIHRTIELHPLCVLPYHSMRAVSSFDASRSVLGCASWGRGGRSDVDGWASGRRDGRRQEHGRLCGAVARGREQPLVVWAACAVGTRTHETDKKVKLVVHWWVCREESEKLIGKCGERARKRKGG